MKRQAESNINDHPSVSVLRNFRALNDSLRGEPRLGHGRHGIDMVVHVVEKPVNEKAVKEHFCALATRLCAEHPTIETDAKIKGGIPRIKGSRLAVSQVLGRIYTLGSIDAVAEYYSPDISKEQIKGAVSFAQDFLETACEPL